MDLISRLVREKMIGFIPQEPDPLTFDNCAICGATLKNDKKEARRRLICTECNKSLSKKEFRISAK